MGLRFRKSVNLGGGFRINLSKSGVGYSWGVPGARITKTASGRNRTTISIPGTGISWVEESGGKKKKNQPRQQRVVDTNYPVPAKTFENADVSEFTSAKYQELLGAINRYSLINYASNAFIVFLILGWLFSEMISFTFYAIAIFCIVVKIYNYLNNRVSVCYDMDAYGEERVKMMKTLVEELGEIESICQINEEFNNSYRDRSPAGKTVNHTPVQVVEHTPGFLKTNVPCYSVKLRDEKLYFLPDKILIEKNMRCGALEYESLMFEAREGTYIEDVAPGDAEIIGETWRYVNKNGSPDRRFKDNYKRYECRYGELELTSEQGFHTIFIFSGKDKFHSVINDLQRYLKEVKSYGKA